MFILVILTMGAFHAWTAATNSSMNPDGISYLDIGDAYFRGDWSRAINAVWSPMYSLVLGLVMGILNPSPRWEFPVVHLVNLLIYLLAFIGFEYYWRKLFIYHKMDQKHRGRAKKITIPEWLWFAIGYSLFIWSALTLIEIWSVTPDMLMSFWVYLAAGLVLRIRLGDMGWGTFAAIGFVLGLGYLTKTIMLPVGMMILVITLFTPKELKRSLPRTLLALVIFTLLAGSFITLLSISKGRITFGEIGNLTYVRYVNGIQYPHWQGDPPGNGRPVHPSRVVWEDPPIYEFSSPVPGTYPIGYDPSYWYEGVTPRYGIKELSRGILPNVLFYFDIFILQLGVVLFGISILYTMGSRLSVKGNNAICKWGLAIVALVTLGLYALVYVEGRYIAVFIMLLFGDLFANLRQASTQPARKLTNAVGVLIAVFVLMNVFFFNLAGFGALRSTANKAQGLNDQHTLPSARPVQVAEELHQLGINDSDRVGVIGYAFDSFWARLARVQIVAEMFNWQADDFYLGDSAMKSAVYDTFANSGAKAIVAEHVPLYASLEGWYQVGNSNYYIYLLQE
jgi:hypothetical protein